MVAFLSPNLSYLENVWDLLYRMLPVGPSFQATPHSRRIVFQNGSQIRLLYSEEELRGLRVHELYADPDGFVDVGWFSRLHQMIQIPPALNTYEIKHAAYHAEQADMVKEDIAALKDAIQKAERDALLRGNWSTKEVGDATNETGGDKTPLDRS